jgi:hypothetical protein
LPRQPVIPPAPLTGDVGRGCGDASRAQLFVRLLARPMPSKIAGNVHQQAWIFEHVSNRRRRRRTEISQLKF